MENKMEIKMEIKWKTKWKTKDRMRTSPLYFMTQVHLTLFYNYFSRTLGLYPNKLSFYVNLMTI